MKYLITIDKMGCGHCVARVTAALNDAGASVESVKIGSAVAEFSGDVDTLKAAVEEIGFDIVSIEAK